MKKKTKQLLVLILIAIVDIIYLFIVPLVRYPVLTAFAIVFLLLSVVGITCITGNIAVVMDKKNRFFLIKNKPKKNEKD
jgi:hypothetical protein